MLITYNSPPTRFDFSSFRRTPESRETGLREPLKINFFILTDAETHPICTLRTFRNPLRTLRLNPNYFNRKGRKALLIIKAQRTQGIYF